VTRYSVVIPTKRRADTLRHVLRNVLSSPREDLEVIVHHCGPDTATDQVIAAIRDERLRYMAVADPLPMRENWETALSHATGRYVTVLGDDDGIVPGAFEVVDRLLARHPAELVTWGPATYFWPTYFDEAVAGRTLYQRADGPASVVFSSRYALHWLYRFKWHYSDMPMIYNSFVSRTLIDRVHSRLGRYFHLNLPDVTSGVLNAAHCDEFVWCNAPLTIAGISRNSTGHRIAMQDDANLAAQAVAEFMPEPVDRRWIPAIGNLEFSIAAELLALRDKVGLDREGVDVDMAEIAEYLARHLQHYPLQIDSAVAALEALCARHRIDFDELRSRFLLRRLPSGAAMAPAISTSPDVAEAARHLTAYLGDAGAAESPRVGFASPELVVGAEPLELGFSRTGNGPQYLSRGWNAPEAFGTWSCAHEATIDLPRLRLPANCSRVRLELSGRGPITGEGARFFFAATVSGTSVSVAGEFSAARPAGAERLEISPADLAGAERLRIHVRCVQLVNAALLGTSHDNRPLGFGLERLVLSAHAEAAASP
jgi:hypothetical protein